MYFLKHKATIHSIGYIYHIEIKYVQIKCLDILSTLNTSFTQKQLINNIGCKPT